MVEIEAQTEIIPLKYFTLKIKLIMVDVYFLMYCEKLWI